MWPCHLNTICVQVNIVYFAFENQVDSLPLIFYCWVKKMINMIIEWLSEWLLFWQQGESVKNSLQSMHCLSVILYKSSAKKLSTNLVANLSNYNLVNWQSFIHISSVDFAIWLIHLLQFNTAIKITLNFSHQFSAVHSLGYMVPVWTFAVCYINWQQWFIFKVSKAAFTQSKINIILEFWN